VGELGTVAGLMAHLSRSVSGAAAHTGLVGGAVYGTSKRPLSLLTRSWAAEYGPPGVNVNELAPGPVATRH
jgi:NAD(P)-dependent dehydrogenase (short-subunit alcohol dehydrogenase family)